MHGWGVFEILLMAHMYMHPIVMEMLLIPRIYE